VAFLEWMSFHRADWADRPDCSGVLMWLPHENHFTHRHGGYTQPFIAHTVRDDAVTARTRGAS
jgi:hypothetical protein